MPRALPLLIVGFSNWMRREHSGVIYQHAQPAKFARCAVNHASDRVRISKIGADYEVPIAEQSGRDLLGRSSVAPVMDRNAIARDRKCSCDRGPNPPRRACNKNRTTLGEAIAHLRPSYAKPAGALTRYVSSREGL